MKTWAEVEVNTDDQYQCLSVYYVITRRFRSRDYHVTFPRVFPIGQWGRSILALGDVGESPGKSSLFFLRTEHPGIRLAGDRVEPPATLYTLGFTVFR